MQRIRLTYAEAMHHAMNRGHGGEKIFAETFLKKTFLDILEAASRKMKMRILAYCLMDNHYHLVVENSSGKLSEFFKLLNGQYGSYYRKKMGGRGYVFQGRFRSEIIQDDSYLINVIAYVLMNPVHAGMVNDFMAYPWSSAADYYRKKSAICHLEYVRELFGSERNYVSQIQKSGAKELPVLRTDIGDVIGGESFAEKALQRFERRMEKDSLQRKRQDDHYFEPLAKVIREFEQMKKVNIDEIDISGFAGKRLRGELLIYLKDNCGLTYSEIAEINIFSDIQMTSLGKLYKDASRRIKHRSKEVKHRAK
jgi:putative transposase